MTAERAGGEGEFVCRMDGSALDDWQRKGKRGRDDVLCGNEARAEDEVEGRKTVVATPTGATTEENKEKCKFDSTRILLRLTTNDFCYDSYCFPLYSVGGGGGSPPPRALLAPPTFPSASRAFLTPSPYIYLSPSLPSSSLSLTRHAAPAKPHRYRILPSVPPTPRPPPRREGYRAPSEDRRSC